jgi:SMODS domain-containing protein
VWQYVIPHFDAFLKQLELTPEDRKDAEGKAERIARSLYAKYYPSRLIFDSSCYLKVGSYGKDTAAACDTDLDMLFVLPRDVFYRVENFLENKQSRLLQEVKNAMFFTFPRTPLRADGPIIAAPFSSYHIEVIPGFRCDDGTYLTAHTSNGGSWRYSNPAAELAQLKAADLATVGKASHLTKMLKAWKYECNVDIKSISLEVLATVFAQEWQFRYQTVYYYDWMIRDFFRFMLEYVNGWTRVPGTQEKIELGITWATKCASAYQRALKACEFEQADYPISATIEWQKIFGSRFAGTAMTPLLRKALA